MMIVVNMRISESIREAESAGIHVRAWDLLFYASFGVMVTQSVSIAGVLVVFSYLIIPATCAMMFVDGFFRSLLMAWGIALGVSFSGLILSAWKDLPTGPSLVATFGAVLVEKLEGIRQQAIRDAERKEMDLENEIKLCVVYLRQFLKAFEAHYLYKSMELSD